ncbi:hypothetical protein [Gemella haemolysans]
MPKTGDVTVTPKKPDGSTYPPGTKVEIPGKVRMETRSL